MRGETETDRAADSGQGREPGNKSGSHIDKWVRPSPNSKFIKGLDKALNLTIGMVRKDIRRIEKQIKQAQKVRNG